MKWKKTLGCIGAGVLLFLAAEMMDTKSVHVEKGVLYRNSCGQGDAVYELFVENEEGQRIKTSLTVPEQKMTEEEFRRRIPLISETLCMEICGENTSLTEVRSNLNLLTELSDYGVSVSWKSQMPEVVSRSGVINQECVSPEGSAVVLEATIQCGDSLEVVEIPVVAYPRESSWEERFQNVLSRLVQENAEAELVILPAEFEDQRISYGSPAHRQNLFLIFLGAAAGLFLHLKEKSDLREKKKQREEELMFSYQDLVSNFLILIGAGYPPKKAWKKMTMDRKEELEDKSANPSGILQKEMQIALNQMETGVSETRAYAEFGRRCGIRCYVRFASLLESCVQTGGKNLRTLLEAEMEEAFRQRADLAKKKGEEASSKLLLPLFGMLGIVMIMVAAPAFLSFT